MKPYMFGFPAIGVAQLGNNAKAVPPTSNAPTARRVMLISIHPWVDGDKTLLSLLSSDCMVRELTVRAASGGKR